MLVVVGMGDGIPLCRRSWSWRYGIVAAGLLRENCLPGICCFCVFSLNSFKEREVSHTKTSPAALYDILNNNANPNITYESPETSSNPQETSFRTPYHNIPYLCLAHTGLTLPSVSPQSSFLVIRVLRIRLGRKDQVPPRTIIRRKRRQRRTAATAAGDTNHRVSPNSTADVYRQIR